MLNKSQKSKLKSFRTLLEKERKRLRINEPHFTIALDEKTDKIQLCYSLSVENGIDINGNRKFKKKPKKKNILEFKVTDDRAIDIFEMNVQKYADTILSEMNKTTKALGTDKDSINYWKQMYNNPMRIGNIVLTEKSVRDDITTIDKLIEYIELHNPLMLNIWEWVDNGRDFLVQYMKHKQSVVDDRKVWSDGTVMSEYMRLRGFFNFISKKLKGYPYGFMNKMPFKKGEIKIETFSSMEINIVKQFIEDEADNPKWSWYIPLLHTMLETGCRISELVKLLIKDLDIDERRVGVLGKGKKRCLYLKSDTLWDRLNPYIFTSVGKIRNDKEHIFHRSYNVVSYGKYFQKDELSKPFSTRMIQNKFKDMIVELKLSEHLTPHDCRRYFITEMLKKTSGDIPLVSELVGHSTWDMVKRYAKSVIDENKKTNVGLFD